MKRSKQPDEPGTPGLTPREDVGVPDRVHFSERRRRRAAFLAALYAATDGHVAEFVAAPDLAADLGMAAPELERVIAYLEERHWIAVDDHRAGIVRITAQGVDAVEAVGED